MEPGQNSFSECRANFDLFTYHRGYPSVKNTHSFSCEEAKVFLERLPKDRLYCSRRIENLNLKKDNRSYVYHSGDTADMSVRRIKLFEHKLLPEGL